jgi:AcrR family transcriptional regulator
MAQSRKEVERHQRRELLLEAAGRVFGRRPFDEATMQEVAAEAQIGMQGLYEHFPSKQELYEQLILQHAQAFHARAEAIVHREAPALEVLRELSLAYAEQFKHRPMSLPTFIRDRVHFDWGFNSRFSPRFREIYEVDRAHLKNLIIRATAEGALDPQDPDYLTQLWLDVLQASLYHSHRNLPEEDVNACVDRALNCLLRGVGAHP